MVVGFRTGQSFGRRLVMGFDEFQRQLKAVGARFQRLILLVHGDGLRFRTHQPLPGPAGPWAHVTRVETFGWPYSHQWIQVHFDPSASPVFRFSVRIAGATLPNTLSPQ